MASETGISPAAVIPRLEAEGRSFAFMSAVALLEAELGTRVDRGPRTRAEAERIHFRAEASLAFPAADISAIAVRDADAERASRCVITIPFLGVFGPSSPLPAFYTERILQDDEGRDNLRDFLDPFNHILTTLLVRAWRYPRAHERFQVTADDPFSRTILRLSGAGDLAVAPDATADREAQVFLSLSGLLALRARSAATLERVLSTVLMVDRVTVEEWIERTRPIPAELQSRLGRRTAELGRGLVLGRSSHLPDAAIRIHLFGLDEDRQADLLPGGKNHDALSKLIMRLAGDLAEVEIAVHTESSTPSPLGHPRTRLGWTCRLANGASDPPPARFSLSPTGNTDHSNAA